MSISAASEIRSFKFTNFTNIKTVANDNHTAAGKSYMVRLYEGKFKINGQDISVFKDDKLSDIIDKINKVQYKSGVKAVVTGRGDEQKIELRSIREKVEILDKNGVLSDIVERGYLGTEKSNLIQVVSDRLAKFSEVDVFYLGREKNNIISPISLLSDELIFSLRYKNDDYLYYIRPQNSKQPQVQNIDPVVSNNNRQPKVQNNNDPAVLQNIGKPKVAPNNFSKRHRNNSSITKLNNGIDDKIKSSSSLHNFSNPGFANIAFGIVASAFKNGASKVSGAVNSAIDAAADYLK